MKVLQGHKQCIFQVVPDAVFKFCLYRKNIKAYKDKRNDQYGAADDHEISYHAVGLHTNAKIEKQDQPDDHHSQPDQCGLTEVFFKGFKKVPGRIPFVCTDPFHAAVIQCCGGGSHGHNGETAKKPQKMEGYNIAHKIEKTGKHTVIRKQVHSTTFFH